MLAPLVLESIALVALLAIPVAFSVFMFPTGLLHLAFEPGEACFLRPISLVVGIDVIRVFDVLVGAVRVIAEDAWEGWYHAPPFSAAPGAAIRSSAPLD